MDVHLQHRGVEGNDVSPSLVSKLTDKIMPQVAEWQACPLERIYAMVFLDAIHFKVRKDNSIVRQVAYSVFGINLADQKDILGILWVGETKSASFWLGVCNELKSRGVAALPVRGRKPPGLSLAAYRA